MRRAQILLVLALIASCATTPSLTSLSTWGIQLQGLSRPGAPDRLVASDLDLIVIDRPSTLTDSRHFPTDSLVRRLRATGKLCLAYQNVGQAEDYRAYWATTWKAPDPKRPGSPAFMLTTDPDGWPGNYPVAFWDSRWEELQKGLVMGAAAEGFDGVMLDWVAGWSDPRVADAARAADVDPARAMADLVRSLAEHARGRRPGFAILLNDGAALVERVPDLANAVDGVVQESVCFAGKATDAWDDPANADVPIPPTGDWSTETHVRRLSALRAKGLVVLVLDYAARPENRTASESLARRHGFVPFVSRTPLDRLP